MSIISQYFKEVKPFPPSGLGGSDNCIYEVSVTKDGEKTFVTLQGKDLNSYGDSKLDGTDGFQQSLLKSLYRSLKNKRKVICDDYGELIEKCKDVVVEKIPKKVEPVVVPNKVQIQKSQIIEKSSYYGEFIIQGVTGKIETNFKMMNNKLIGDYNYVYKGVRNNTGKLYDTKIINNKLELVWEEKESGKVYRGKLIIDINNDWSEFHGTTIQNGEKTGPWNGKLKGNKKSVIQNYLNLSK